LDVELVHFPLHPETPDEGRALAELFGTSEEKIRSGQKRMAELAAAERLPWGERLMTYNSRLAQELGIWADRQGEADVLHDALYRAYFVDGHNISQHDVLLNVVQRVGLDREAAAEVLKTRSCRAAVEADWLRALHAGVRAVPTFACGNRAIEGAVAYDVLRQLVMDAGGTPREVIA
jgi:predicted DsbA family dithiol-disulfide isomerase